MVCWEENKKFRLPDCFYVSGHLVSDPILIAMEFNNIFSNIGSKLAQQFSPTTDFKNYLNENILSRFKFSHVTNQQVTKIVMSFKNSSPGVDGLPMRLFKDNINVLADTIVFICNRSLDTGIFPKKLMIAMITCLHKAGDLHNLENYRAISILCAFSKILEKIVALQLVEYFIENNILTECQFGYRSGVPTSDAVLY